MKLKHTDPVKGLSDEQLAAMIAELEERIARRADQAKLIEGEAVETTALPAPVQAFKGRPNKIMEAAETAIGPQEHKPRKRVPSPAST